MRLGNFPGKHPLKSFARDWIMWFDMLRGRVGLCG